MTRSIHTFGDSEAYAGAARAFDSYAIAQQVFAERASAAAQDGKVEEAP